MLQFFMDTALNLLRNSAFQANIELVVALIAGIVVPFVRPAPQHRRGKIAYMHIVQYSPGSSYNVKWKIWNCGHTTIEPKDYRKDPIKFTFGDHASVKGVKIIKSIVDLHPILKGDSCELAPVFLDKGHSFTLEFLVKDVDVKNIKVDLVVAGHDSIDMIARATSFLQIVFVLLAVWVVTFIVYFKFPQLSVVHYISVCLVFLIAWLGTRSIFYLVSSHAP